MAAATARPGHGTLFKIEVSAATYTTIAEVVDISGPGMSRTAIDMTHMESPAFSGGAICMEKYPGIIDPGEIDVSLHFRPGETNFQILSTNFMRAPFVAATNACQIVFPDATPDTWTVLGFVSGMSPAVQVNDVMMCTIKFTVSGIVTGGGLS